MLSNKSREAYINNWILEFCGNKLGGKVMKGHNNKGYCISKITRTITCLDLCGVICHYEAFAYMLLTWKKQSIVKSANLVQKGEHLSYTYRYTCKHHITISERLFIQFD